MASLFFSIVSPCLVLLGLADSVAREDVTEDIAESLECPNDHIDVLGVRAAQQQVLQLPVVLIRRRDYLALCGFDE